MTKQEILDEFKDINFAYNNSSKYETLSMMLDELLKEKEGYVSVPFSWLVKFCTHIDFNEPMWDADREKLWKQKLKQQFDIDIPC